MFRKTHKLLQLLALVFALQLVAPAAQLEAQCPMCRMSAETNLKNGGSAGKGLNAGILYMLATPYLLVGAIGFIWYRNRRKDEDEEI
ncbi:MAG: hypothetical protein KDC30_08135 [Saprospiraceae bacterium]|nr:hypothetical protein [Saprospiraceae bacterium]MCB0676640.1 hypothetical protein [Saprospiraceae bacterium]